MLKRAEFDFDAFFLRRFPKFKELEKRCRELETSEAKMTEVAKDLEGYIGRLQKKAKSDANVINSLNRYIEALEGKAAMQAELAQELREKLNTLLAVPNNRKGPREETKA